jgi:hypothetical protein
MLYMWNLAPNHARRVLILPTERTEDIQRVDHVDTMSRHQKKILVLMTLLVMGLLGWYIISTTLRIIKVYCICGILFGCVLTLVYKCMSRLDDETNRHEETVIQNDDVKKDV